MEASWHLNWQKISWMKCMCPREIFLALLLLHIHRIPVVKWGRVKKGFMEFNKDEIWESEDVVEVSLLKAMQLASMCKVVSYVE